MYSKYKKELKSIFRTRYTDSTFDLIRSVRQYVIRILGQTTKSNHTRFIVHICYIIRTANVLHSNSMVGFRCLTQYTYIVHTYVYAFPRPGNHGQKMLVQHRWWPWSALLFSSFEKKVFLCLALLALHHGLYHRGVAPRHRAAATTAAFEGTAELFSCRCILRGSDSFLKSAFCAMILAWIGKLCTVGNLVACHTISFFSFSLLKL